MIKKIGLVVSLGLSLVISSNVYAQTPTASGSGKPAQVRMVLLASVDMTQATATQNADGSVAVYFVLSTTDTEQKNIRYSVSLTDATEKTVYSYVFQKTVNLVKNTPVTVKDTFTPPVDMSGTYGLVLSATNENGLPLANGKIESFKLVSNGKSSISVTNCVSTKETYKKDEAITISCTVNGKETASSTLKVDMYTGNEKTSVYKKIVPFTESKGSIAIPAQTEPGQYTLTVQAYEGPSPVGTTQVSSFMVEGASVRIISLSGDKPQYESGDTAQVVAGLSIFSNQNLTLHADATLHTMQGVACGNKVTMPLNSIGSVSLSIPVTVECNGYTLTLTIVDDQGIVLDTKVVKTDGKESSTLSTVFGTSNSPLRYIWYVVVLAALAAIGMRFFTAKKI